MESDTRTTITLSNSQVSLPQVIIEQGGTPGAIHIRSEDHMAVLTRTDLQMFARLTDAQRELVYNFMEYLHYGISAGFTTYLHSL